MKQGGGLYSRVRVGAILLAAGEGRRMGVVAKALIQLQDVPLINRQLIALSGAGVDEADGGCALIALVILTWMLVVAVGCGCCDCCG